jgi:predicted ATPase
VIELSEFVFETVREDGELALSRGRREREPSAILVLAPASEYPAFGALDRLEHEYSLRDQLDPEWSARPLALSHQQGRRALVLEDPGGTPLHWLVGQPMEMSRFLRFAVGLVTAVGRIHERGLVHKDLKPANFLVDSATGHAWLTGFGIASPLPRQHQAPEPPEVIAGTLAYMAPEQTGRMNRSIDCRSDLYSLGVTLYEMLTGVLPFTAANPMEWVHCHIARRPPGPEERIKGVPGPISAVIMKLLAKTAEERYQTASGLKFDFQQCLAEWEAHGFIDPFPLGTRDTSDRLLIPEKLYGRKFEIEALVAAFERVVAGGTPELVLVSGYSGIGKSSIVNELHKVLVPPRGLFAAGKFDRYKRNVPYATLAQAFQSLVRQILGKHEAEVSRWRDGLREALGQNGQLMVGLIPELELVIGEQPPIADLSPQDAQNRFQSVFLRFLGAFARAEHPLALFLDDLQWLDAATLELLKRLVNEPDVHHLLLVGAYRDNEVGPLHPLARTLEQIRKVGTRVQEIVLVPLSIEDITQLVVDSLHCEFPRARPLAQLIHEKTGGNPFFAIQFLTTLAEEGLLAFDPGAARWTWDPLRIHAKGFTDNVVDFMAGKLDRLPQATQETLGQLACLGNSARTAILSLVLESSEETLRAALWEAVRAGLVFEVGGAYAFVHDRVQEAAYALIPEELRAELHLRIGRSLIAKMNQEQIEEKIFDIVNQLNSGRTLLADLKEKDLVARLNLRAGTKAKASAAYHSACIYFSLGMDLAGSDAWERRYELAFDLWLGRAESEFLNGGFDEAEKLIAELLEKARSRVDKVAAYRLRILLLLMKAEYRPAVDRGLECLRLFNIEMPAHPTRAHVQVECEKIWQNLGDRSIESLVDLPSMTDPEMQAAMGIVSVIAAPAFNIDINLMYLFFCQMVNASLKYGTTSASAHGYAELATILGPVFHRYLDGYRFGKLACRPD